MSNMLSHTMFHFSLQRNNKLFQIMIQPGTQWDEIQQALDIFKDEFVALHKDAIKQEEATKEKDNATQCPEGSV